LWLLAELTYRCPLQCPYCSNPLDFAKWSKELNTEQWISVLQQARKLGAAQLGFSGGEPLVRQDLEELIREGHKLGFYTNLITSGVGMDESRVQGLKEAGLDHIQISFQASSAELNDMLAGSNKAFEHKVAMAKAVKDCGYPMVLNFVIHRQNVDDVDKMLMMAEELNADYVELANAQYYGWALENRDQLLPTREQLKTAEKETEAFRETTKTKMQVYFVVPDYFESEPKPCMGGWGATFMSIAPDGTALPCHSARVLPIDFPNVKDSSIKDIWYQSKGFNMYRGDEWMQSPCNTCSQKGKDFGGCRCQAYLLTGDATNADPVCSLSPFRETVEKAIDQAIKPNQAAVAQSAKTKPVNNKPVNTRPVNTKPMLFRNSTNSKKFV